MIKNNTVYFKKTLIDSFEISEIDFDFHDYIGFDYEKHDDYQDIAKPQSGYEIGFPLSIETLIKKLTELNAKGATHIALEYHEDHIGYMIEAWGVSMASEEEVKKWESKLKRKKLSTIEEEKQKLKKRLEELEGLE